MPIDDLERDLNAAKSALVAANAAFNKGLYQDALPHFQQAEELLQLCFSIDHPDLYQCFRTHADALYALNRFDEASRIYEGVSKFNGEAADVLALKFKLAKSYDRAGNKDRATRAYEDARTFCDTKVPGIHPLRVLLAEAQADFLKRNCQDRARTEQAIKDARDTAGKMRNPSYFWKGIIGAVRERLPQPDRKGRKKEADDDDEHLDELAREIKQLDKLCLSPRKRGMKEQSRPERLAALSVDPASETEADIELRRVAAEKAAEQLELEKKAKKFALPRVLSLKEQREYERNANAVLIALAAFLLLFVCTLFSLLDKNQKVLARIPIVEANRLGRYDGVRFANFATVMTFSDHGRNASFGGVSDDCRYCYVPNGFSSMFAGLAIPQHDLWFVEAPAMLQEESGYYLFEDSEDGAYVKEVLAKYNDIPPPRNRLMSQHNTIIISNVQCHVLALCPIAGVADILSVLGTLAFALMRGIDWTTTERLKRSLVPVAVKDLSIILPNLLLLAYLLFYFDPRTMVIAGIQACLLPFYRIIYWKAKAIDLRSRVS